MLAKPPATTGIFQTSTAGGVLGGRPPTRIRRNWYADQKVLAFPVPPESVLPVPVVTASGGNLNAAALGDGDLEKVALDLPRCLFETGNISWVQFDYGRPVTIRGLTFSTPPRDRCLLMASTMGWRRRAAHAFRLEASDDAFAWRDTGAQVQTGPPSATTRWIVPGRYFRFVSVKQAPAPARRRARFERPDPPPPATSPFMNWRCAPKRRCIPSKKRPRS